jgi:ribosome-associated translation inhibitor RaiA
MLYQISGKQIDVGQALQTHVETELSGILGKYAGRFLKIWTRIRLRGDRASFNRTNSTGN